jgi:hypothetical protein
MRSTMPHIFLPLLLVVRFVQVDISHEGAEPDTDAVLEFRQQALCLI